LTSGLDNTATSILEDMGAISRERMSATCRCRSLLVLIKVLHNGCVVQDKFELAAVTPYSLQMLLEFRCGDQVPFRARHCSTSGT